MHRLCLLALALVLAAAAHAQDDPDAVAADRPGFGDGAAIVAQNRLQIEVGYAYTDADGATQHNIGQVAVRMGLMPRVELRVLLNSFVVVDTPDGNVTGQEDFTVGAKVRILTAASGLALSGQVSAFIPTGDDEFSNDKVVPELKLILDAPLTSTIGFSSNAGLTFDFDEGPNTFFTYVSLGAAMPGAEGLGVFAGLFSLFPEDADSDHGVDGGLVYLLNKATQVDVSFGTMLTDNQSDFFVGAGIARRF